MPKNILHDVMTSERRSIRQVPLPGGKHKAPKEEEEEDLLVYEREEVSVTEDSVGGRRWWLWGFAALFLAFLGFVLMSGFGGATLTVTPKSVEATVGQEFVASADPLAKLHYELLPVTKADETLIPADTTKQVSEKASGTIVVYNAFSSIPQRLIKNTRFESPEGRIYRIKESITVPGQKSAGGKTTPGSVEVQVFADAAGKAYNLALADFTIPGFKSDAKRYAGFYARSKTAISGGFSGTVKTASTAALASARETLAKKLEEAVRAEVKAKIPTGFVLFPTALVIARDEKPPVDKGGSVSVRETLTGSAYLFKRTELAAAIAREKQGGDFGAEIPELDSLQFRWSEQPVASSGSTVPVRFALNGKARLVFLYDADKLRVALLGKQRSDIATVLSQFPTIEKIDVILRPFWSSTFPTNTKRLIIK